MGVTVGDTFLPLLCGECWWHFWATLLPGHLRSGRQWFVSLMSSAPKTEPRRDPDKVGTSGQAAPCLVQPRALALWRLFDSEHAAGGGGLMCSLYNHMNLLHGCAARLPWLLISCLQPFCRAVGPMKTPPQFCYRFCSEPRSRGTGSAQSGQVQCCPNVPRHLEKVRTWYVPSSVSLPRPDSGSQLSSAGGGGVNRASVWVRFSVTAGVLTPGPADHVSGNYRDDPEGARRGCSVVSCPGPARNVSAPHRLPCLWCGMTKSSFIWSSALGQRSWKKILRIQGFPIWALLTLCKE